MPLAATTTKLHITSNGTSPTTGAAKERKTSKNERDPFREQRLQNSIDTAPEAEKSEDTRPETISKKHDSRPEAKTLVPEVPKAANESVSWLNWFSKSEIGTGDERSSMQPDADASRVGKNDPQSDVSEALQDAPIPSQQRRSSEPSPVSPNVQPEEAPRSWLSLWVNASSQTRSSSSASAIDVASDAQNDSNGAGLQTGKLADVEADLVSIRPPQQLTDGTKPSYGWAFWSRDQTKSDDEKARPGREIGELALAGSSSQSKLESAVVDEARGVPNKVAKRQRPQSLEVVEDLKKPRSAGDDDAKCFTPEAVDLAPILQPKVDAGSKAKLMPENLLLPSFRSTYSEVGRPSFIQQISRFLQLSSPLEPKHVVIVQNPPRVKRALAIVSLARCVEHGLHSHG